MSGNEASSTTLVDVVDEEEEAEAGKVTTFTSLPLTPLRFISVSWLSINSATVSGLKSGLYKLKKFKL